MKEKKILAWSIYLVLSQMFLDRNDIKPETVPCGPFGWWLAVEAPRALIGVFIIRQLARSGALD